MKHYRQNICMDYKDPLNVYLEKIGNHQFADLAFQANFWSRWSQEEKEAFIRSVFLAHAPSKFIFADTQKCLEAAEERGDVGDIIYFKFWAERTKYLNIDSNNRNICLREFIKGLVKIPHAKYTLTTGAVVEVYGENDTYDTLDEEMAIAFQQAMISSTIYTDASRKDLSTIFVNINAGKPLNAPEVRSAEVTEVANVIRKLAEPEQHGNYFAHVDQSWFRKQDINRRYIDDFIAGCAYYYAYGIDANITNVTLEKFYLSGSHGEEQIHKFKTRFNDFMKNLMIDNARAIANRNSILDLFIIYDKLRNDNLKVTDPSGLIKAYIKVISKLLLSKKYYKTTKKSTQKYTFEGILGGRQNYNNVKRNSLIMKSLDISKFTIKIDPKRGYNKQDRMILASNNDFKTLEDKPIDMSKLMSPEYHGGHREPHADGNPSDIDNGGIQEKHDNWELGKNSFETKKKKPVSA